MGDKMGSGSNYYNLIEGALPVVVKLYPQDDSTTDAPCYSEGYQEPLLQAKMLKQRAGDVNMAVVEFLLSDWLSMTGQNPLQVRPEHYNDYVWVDDMAEIGFYGWQATITPIFIPLFVGFLANPRINIQGKGRETVTFEVLGFGQRLKDVQVRGRIVKTKNHDQQVLEAEAPTFSLDTEIRTADWTIVDLPLIFNEDAKPNATQYNYKKTRGQLPIVKQLEEEDDEDEVEDEEEEDDEEEDGPTVEYPIFEDSERKIMNATAKSWTLADAMKYLLFSYNDERYVLNPDADTIENMMDAIKISHVDLRGMDNLFDAIKQMLVGTPFSFYIDPVPFGVSQDEDVSVPESGYLKRCGLVFFKRGQGPSMPVYLDPPGTALPDSLSNVEQLSVQKNTSAAVRTVEVMGDFEYIQKTFVFDASANDRAEGTDFIRAWSTFKRIEEYYDGSDFITEREEQWNNRYNMDGKDFSEYSDYFRVFALNEAGDYNYTYNRNWRPRIYSFDDVFGRNRYMVRRRKFYKNIEFKDSTVHREYYPPTLEISFDGGDNYQPVKPSAFELADDECKVRITVNRLVDFCKIENNEDVVEENYLYGLKTKKLRLKLTACVRSDERILGSSYANAAGATRFNNKRLIENQKGLLLKRGINAIVDSANFDKKSDLPKAYIRAISTLAVLQDGVSDTKLTLSGINLGMMIGDLIKKVEGREISLGSREGTGAKYPQVVGIDYMFGDKRHLTNLDLDVYRG